MKLVIAEKPSVAQSIAKVIGAYERHDGYVEGSGYLVSWCIGHLVELAEPDAYNEKYQKWRTEDLPVIPEAFQWQVAKDKRAQFVTLKQLMERSDVEELVCATDAGREGELIVRLVYEQAGCSTPFKRLWISSMEDAAIEEGFANLRDGHAYDDLYQAALSRSKADWIVGINATRLFTTLYNKRLTVGRVQTPTLAMLVERNAAITGFVKQMYCNVHLDCEGLEVTKEKIFDAAEADAIMEKCDGMEGVVTSVKKNRKTVQPPKLFDLTTLQREANRYLGLTAKQTLDTAQSLYEKKLITYPRTDSRYLTSDMAETAKSMVLLIAKVFAFERTGNTEPDIGRLINNTKVSDHHAIIPTAEIGKQDLKGLSDREHAVLRLIAGQMLCAAAEKHEYLETEIKVMCEGEEFSSKGKQVIAEGWKAIEAECKGREKGKAGDTEEDPEPVLPDVREGQHFENCWPSISEHYTTPPKQYTEDSLLSAMETAGNEHFEEDTEKKGLGTPATRASMIEKLVSSRYVQRKGKQLIPTEDGINLISVMPETIKSPVLTAEWENTLMQVEKGNASADAFLAGICDSVRELVHQYSALPEEERNRFKGGGRREAIGNCPRCGSPVYEGEKNFYCSSRECRFCIWKESRWLSGLKKKVNTRMAKALLLDGKVHVAGFYSKKTGNNFDADLVMEDTGQYVNFHLEFPNRKKGGKA